MEKIKKIDVLFLDVKNGAQIKQIQIKDELDDYRETLRVSAIDIVRRNVGKKSYCFVVDDVGALDRWRIMSATDYNGYPELYGNLIITGLANSEGELTGLKQSDVDNICRAVRKAYSFILGKEYYRIRLSK